MKTIYFESRKSFLQAIFLIAVLLAFSPLYGQEFLLIDKTFTWTETTGGDGCSGYHFWRDLGEATTTNWLTPYNYRDGLFEFRYEIISQPQISPGVYQPFRLSFCIWADLNFEPGKWKENCSGVHDFQGPGVATFAENPTGWWAKEWGGIDWSRLDKLWRFGNPFWYNADWLMASPFCTNAPDWVWADEKWKFFPMEMRITVVAVAQGYSFSGWDGYLNGGGGTRQPTPDYTINYYNEATNEAVPSTDEYSLNSNMSGAVSGSGSVLSLTPGQDVYFRTKASGGLLESYIQHRTVPEKPNAPSFSLDLANNRTAETVSSEYEYSDNSNMSGATTGNGSYVSIPQGTTKYFRKKATGSAFRSNIQTLNESTQPNTQTEIILLNDTIDYPNSTDDNGFYFFYHNASTMPVNWQSPYDFYNGQVYIRYEIISQSSSEPVGLQFGIWQKLPPVTGTLYEIMSGITTLNGPGDSEVTNSSPNTWWKLDGNNIDWTQMNNVWHFGINPWKVNPSNEQIRQENPAVWAERFTKWFPMKVYVIVVAVANGYSFSGWNQFLESPMPTPSYGIDYFNEITNKVVPSTDEYSLNSGMTGAVSGTGSTISLTAGQTVYFRTKAQGLHPASGIFPLSVPARPADPSFAIDYVAENTTTNVTSEYEYSTQLNMSSPINGAGSKVNFTPGTNLYFRKKATVTSFKSGIQMVNVIPRADLPTFAIDYVNERTSGTISNEFEYADALSMVSAITGSSNYVILLPGTTKYFRKKATSSSFKSDVQTLPVPARPGEPAFAIDYQNVRTSTPVSNQYEYADDLSMTSPLTGGNIHIPLVPGTTKYFRKKATVNAFKSYIQTLNIPSRPATPGFTIDFVAETVNQSVTSEYEYANNISMTSATTGNGSKPALTPGNNIYIRHKATVSDFASDIQTLTVPARVDAPAFTINYVNETTNEIASSFEEYSTSSDMSGAIEGAWSVLSLTPGTDLYIREKVTSSSFKGLTQTLDIPQRPALDANAGDNITGFFLVSIDFHQNPDGFELSDIETTNCSISEIASLVLKVTPISEGNVTFKVLPNAINAGNFASATLTKNYALTSISDIKLEKVSIYPNIAEDNIKIIVNDHDALPFNIEVINIFGSRVKNEESELSEYNLDIADMPKGMYFIIISSNNNRSYSDKIIKK